MYFRRFLTNALCKWLFNATKEAPRFSFPYEKIRLLDKSEFLYPTLKSMIIILEKALI